MLLFYTLLRFFGMCELPNRDLWNEYNEDDSLRCYNVRDLAWGVGGCIM